MRVVLVISNDFSDDNEKELEMTQEEFGFIKSFGKFNAFKKDFTYCSGWYDFDEKTAYISCNLLSNFNNYCEV